MADNVTGHNITEDSSYDLGNLTRPSGAILTPVYIYLWIAVVNGVIFLAGCVGNILVIVVVTRVKNMRTPTNYCLVNLSVADLLVLCICQTSAMLEFFAEDRWLLGNTLCHVIPYLELLVTHASILIMLGISFGRYYAVCKPLQSYSSCGRTKTLILMGTMWAIAAITAIPFSVISYTETTTHHNIEELVEVCRTHIYLKWHYVFVFGIFCVFFVLPFFILVFIYSRIIHGVLVESVHMQENSNSFKKRSLKNQKQLICMLLVLVVMFFLCVLPMRVVIFWLLFADWRDVIRLGLENYLNIVWGARVLQYLNSAINPIIYNVFSAKFRWGFKFVLGLEKRRVWSRSSQRTNGSTYYSYTKQKQKDEMVCEKTL